MAIFGTISPGNSLSFKNLIINGNFDVWQRATSTTYNNTTGKKYRFAIEEIQ